MHFASDNAGPAHPKVMEALMQANEGYRLGYGADAEMTEVTRRIREVFEAPDAAVFLVSTGTAANALILATLAQPWQTIFCTAMAHIEEDECNAPEFYSDAKLTLVPDRNAKLSPSALQAAIEKASSGGVHAAQPGPVSLTQVTEKGTVYSLDEINALTDIAKAHNLPVHLDGARFANACVSLGCTPADMTWKAGVDAVSFGGTKNGLLGVEACVIFDPKLTWEFALRRKRGGHLFSKHRYLSAQMLAYLTDDLWLDMAKAANDRMAELLTGLRALPQVQFLYAPEANVAFAQFPRRDHQRLHAAGARYYTFGGDIAHGDPEGMITARFVTDWSITPDAIQQFLTHFAAG